MSTIDEQKVSIFIANELKIEFNNKKFRLNGWGEVDNWCELSDNCYLFLEVETKQKHPNTNILKLWPFLFENSNFRIFLIQTFYPESPGNKSNRGKLGLWTATQLKELFKYRFDYKKLILDGKNDIEELKAINNSINIFKEINIYDN